MTCVSFVDPYNTSLAAMKLIRPITEKLLDNRWCYVTTALVIAEPERAKMADNRFETLNEEETAEWMIKIVKNTQQATKIECSLS